MFITGNLKFAFAPWLRCDKDEGAVKCVCVAVSHDKEESDIGEIWKFFANNVLGENIIHLQKKILFFSSHLLWRLQGWADIPHLCAYDPFLRSKTLNFPVFDFSRLDLLLFFYSLLIFFAPNLQERRSQNCCFLLYVLANGFAVLLLQTISPPALQNLKTSFQQKVVPQLCQHCPDSSLLPLYTQSIQFLQILVSTLSLPPRFLCFVYKTSRVSTSIYLEESMPLQIVIFFCIF